MAAITALTLPVAPSSAAESLGQEISQLCSYLYAAEAKLLTLIRQFDGDECYAALGFHSTAHWLNYQCGIGMNAARERVRVANALPELSKISTAFAAGTLSYSKVRAITRIADSCNEDYLLMIGTYGTAHHVEKLVSRYRRAVRLQDAERAEAVHAGRELSVRFDDDGTMILNGRFPAEQGAVILKAIEMAADQAIAESAANNGARPEDARPGESQSHKTQAANAQANVSAETTGRAPIGMRRADALANLAETFLNHPHNDGNAADRYQVVVHVSAEAQSDDLYPPAETSPFTQPRAGTTGDTAFATAVTAANHPHPPAETSGNPRRQPEVPNASALSNSGCASTLPHPPAVTPYIENGPHLGAETARRIACDCSVVAVKENVFGEPLAIGRKTRSIPPALRRALRMRDGGCRFPGCTHTRFVDGHHIRHWANGGETSLDNLVLLCRQHHRLVHEGGFGCERTPAGEIEFSDCRNVPISNGPPLPGLGEDLDAWLDTQFFEHSIDHDGCRAKHGADERMDWDLAIAALF